ncbi:septum formation inhibitor Maf [Flavobacterium faecale]|uniref:septum formation inhibitor Maf n=1 Tax=Flavobacterium faecale TaxID=1355330 RepID=UPI003AB08531
MRIICALLSLLLLFACKNNDVNAQVKGELSQEMKSYWYNNDAELSSYDLVQARYGELRKGTAVLVYVTEPFSEKSFTKANQASTNTISVLKLNFTKNFNTGIYPYSMMNSSFFPVNGNSSLKISSSTQEWCGHVYTEVKPVDKGFEVNIRSYFEGESIDKVTIKKVLLEDDIWSIIRLNPNALPEGKLEVLPSLFYMRLAHKDLKIYRCEVSKKIDKQMITYSMKYPELRRNLDITFENKFPYKILSWSESYPDGYNNDAEILTTSGTLKKTIKIDYWNKNSNADLELRKDLGLD